MPDQPRRIEIERRHDRLHVSDRIGNAPPCTTRRGGTVAPKIKRDDAMEGG
jgi:hypothetical protein